MNVASSALAWLGRLTASGLRTFLDSGHAIPVRFTARVWIEVSKKQLRRRNNCPRMLGPHMFTRHDVATRGPDYRVLNWGPCRKLWHAAQMCDAVKGLEQISWSGLLTQEAVPCIGNGAQSHLWILAT